MKTLEILAFNREDIGTKEAKRLRAEGQVPGVIYGKEAPVHFYAPAIQFRDLVYTSEAMFVDLNVEGQVQRCILQDIQFHPVSEVILHVDFLALTEGSAIKMNIPVRTSGKAPGVMNGGKLVMKLRYLSIKALPSEMPEEITIDISKLKLGKTIKVGELKEAGYEVLNNPLVSIVGVEIPRALRGGAIDEDEDEETAEVAAEGEAAASEE